MYDEQINNKIKNGKWNEEELQLLKENYGLLTTKEIAKLINRSVSAIQLKANRLGLRFEDKYYYNKNYFNKIDTEEKAYWLGFIYADGCVRYDEQKRNYELAIKLQAKDYEHLKKFNKCLGGNIEVVFNSRTNLFKEEKYKDNIYDECLIRIYNKSMVEDLINHGVYVNKTNKLNFPKWLGENLLWCFMRGFLDGDGHICLPQKGKKYGYRIGFTCNCESFLLELRAFMKQYNIISHINKNRNSFKLEIRNRKSILAFLNLAYKHKSIYLDRKNEKHLKLKELLSNMETY